MKVVAAVDSFKGSMTSMEAGNAVKKGILAAIPDADVLVMPLADGGEGTTDALIEGMHGRKAELTATGPLGDPVSCYYGILPDERTAVMEMASASGITLLPGKKGDPLHASTRGVGEMILDGIRRGCREFIIGIGGSATNDGGIGMLQSLGWKFLDESGAEVGEGAQALGKIARIDESGVEPLLTECSFRIACDVTNELCGTNGATYIYGPQKGVTEEMKEPIDRAMAHYGAIAAKATGHDFTMEQGAGAAGGLGFAFRTFFNAKLVPGVDLILDAIHLEDLMKDADVVVTGEGQLDVQTAMGKAPIGVARLAKRHGAKVLAFAGSVTKEAGACNEAGIDAFFPIVRGISTLEQAMETETAKANMAASVEQAFRLLR